LTDRVLRIGTRDSILATWQAEHVSGLLRRLGHPAELIFIKTEGDLVLDTPLPMLGGKGVFTKALDDALLENRIDLAVHSFKDIPTRLPGGLAVAAVIEREDHRDVLVLRDGLHLTGDDDLPSGSVIATSSHRRGAQWLGRYPGHTLTDIRGNVHTRLKKLDAGSWTGAIFAAAGLKRVGLADRISRVLDWMLPAPAQGALAVMTREDDKQLGAILQHIHHRESELCTGAERQFLNVLEGGCSAPIGALATVRGGRMYLKTSVLSIDGSMKAETELDLPLDEAESIGKRAAELVLASDEGRLVIGSLRGPA
jgi:hydroxymethylbilane synthase